MLLYNDYLRVKYGCKVYRIAIDAGFTCPNRDGTKGTEGCIYCNRDGSRAAYVNKKDSVKRQIHARLKYLKDTKGAKKFIAYFQAFTNTYAPVDILKKTYDGVLGFDDIVGISIGTRPDAIDREKLGLISSYKNRYEAWIEYGLQSIHDKTLKLIQRGHTFTDFLKALELTKEFGIPVSVHVILGLPGETKEDILQTAKKLSELKIDGIKIHLLHILKGSELEKWYNEGRIKILEQDEYVDLACAFLNNLSSDIIIQRLTGQGRKEDHIAPLWALDKIGTLEKIRKKLISNNKIQISK